MSVMSILCSATGRKAPGSTVVPSGRTQRTSRQTGQRVVTDRMLELDLGLDGIADVTQREHPEVTVDHVHLVLGDRHPLDVAVGAHQAQPCARRPTDQVLGQTSDGGRAVVGMNEVGGNATG